MGIFNLFKKQQSGKLPETTNNQMSESDKEIIQNAIVNGIPCIPFIPINKLRQSLTILKPEGTKGYFVAKVPALYPDGSVKTLLKEEFMLWSVVNNIISDIEQKGRNYFFIGFETQMTLSNDNEYLNPAIFYQQNYSLFRLDTDEKLKFQQPSHSPTLDLTYIPVDHNIHFKKVHVINFFLVADLYPVEERQDPSGFMLSYDQWKGLQYPLSGWELQSFFDVHVQMLKDRFV